MEDETLEQRHKREQKELQGKIQSLKHGIPKGDKKRKKEMTIEIAKLQADLDALHEDELKNHIATDEVLSITTETLNLDDGECTAIQSEQQQPKMSKAQKRREKKEAEEKARQKRLEEGERESVNHSRNVEAKQFIELLRKHKLKIIEVQPDGDCLYNSILVQLTDATQSVSTLRCSTCDHMTSNMNDYIMFTTNTTTGDMLQEEEFHAYCEAIKNTKAWGGQLELKALSHVLKRSIEVYQTSSSTILIGQEFNDNNPIRVSYHRHQYGLGEHYNAVLPDT